jgi:myo-inositol-1(or 4)-monophosphatase
MDWELLLKTAETAAREAGGILRDGGTRLKSIEFQDARDVKLRADREAEERIRASLMAVSSYPIVGEELGGDAGLVGQYVPYWVVDPLDGTYNYLRGSALCAVSIGLMRGETPLLGVIYDFHSDRCYSGIAGGEFRVDGAQHEPSWEAHQDQGVLATGFPAGMDRDSATMESFLHQIAAFKKVRMIGSAALALAYVAEGTYDVYTERSIRLWDVAAGLALVQAAGGSVRMKQADPSKPFAYDIWAGQAAFFPSH